MSAPLGAAADSDRDDEGRERAGKKQEQLLTARASQHTGRVHSSTSDLSQSLWLLFLKYFSRRSQLGSTPDFRYPVSASSMMDSNSDHYGSALVLRRPQKGRMAALRDEPSKVRSQLICWWLIYWLFTYFFCDQLIWWFVFKHNWLFVLSIKCRNKNYKTNVHNFLEWESDVFNSFFCQSTLKNINTHHLHLKILEQQMFSTFN